MLPLTTDDVQALWLTVKLAVCVTLILMCVSLPLARWLCVTKSKLKAPVNALISLPLVLPPTVLGFYLLLLLGKNGPVGALTESLGLGYLPFSFWGLVIASCVYSLPFTVQPLYSSMSAIDPKIEDVAATLGANSVDRFFSIVLPLSRPGLLAAAVLGFAHTLGEFGIVLMIGGNIPGETRVISVQIYDYVDMLQYHRAHILSGLMLVVSFLLLLSLYLIDKQSSKRLWQR